MVAVVVVMLSSCPVTARVVVGVGVESAGCCCDEVVVVVAVSNSGKESLSCFN